MNGKLTSKYECQNKKGDESIDTFIFSNALGQLVNVMVWNSMFNKTRKERNLYIPSFPSMPWDN